MTHRKDSVYLLHIVEAINPYTKGMDGTSFLANQLVQDGVIRQIEIIGEASKNLSSPTRGLSPDIPWKDIAGMRDKLIHQYFGVDLASVWNTVETDLPLLKDKINALLGEIA